MNTKKISINFVWTEDSKRELKEKLNSRSFYITTDGKIAFSSAVLTNDILMNLFTE